MSINSPTLSLKELQEAAMWRLEKCCSLDFNDLRVAFGEWMGERKVNESKRFPQR